MKILLYLLVLLISFAAAVAACLALTGNLSMDAYNKLVHPKPPEEAPAAVKPDDTDPLIQALRAREEDLDKREAQVKEEEERGKKDQADLEALRTELQALQEKIGKTLEAQDANLQERVKAVALTLGKMKPKNAADTLGAWNTAEAAAVLRQVKEKDRGKILDSMKPDKAAEILLALQNPMP